MKSFIILLFSMLPNVISSESIHPFFPKPLIVYLPAPPVSYEILAEAVTMVESGKGKKVYNKAENAVGWFQIRQCRVDHYNYLKKTKYKLTDFYSYNLSLEMFLFYAKGKSPERAAKNWNGSGPMTAIYWKKVKSKIKMIMKMNPKSYDAYRLFHDGTLALARAERQGIRIDVPYIINKKQHLARKIIRLEEQFKDTTFYKEWQQSVKGKVNINSHLQLSNFIYNTKGFLKPKTTKNGGGATDEDTLKQLNIPELDILLQMSKLKKVKDTYLDAFLREQVDGYMHPFFNLHTVVTYRSSSDSPNFQNIPIRDEEMGPICRRALYPRPGHQLVELDFKGIEVAIAACYHKDPTMIKYISDPTSDMHGDMASQIFKISPFDKNIPVNKTLRKAAKNGFVFPQFYGDYYKKCAINMACEWGKLPKGKWKPGQGIDMIGWEPPLHKYHLADHMISKKIKSIDDFTTHIQDIEEDFWNNRFPVYKQWKEDHYEEYQEKGYFDTKTGFRCSGFMEKNQVANYPVQGAAFHCLLWTFTQLDAIMLKEKWDTRLIGQIHDSIILDVKPSQLEYVIKTAKHIAEVLLPEHWKWINVPLSIEVDVCGVDKPWADKKEYKQIA
jgi:DNA polymerase I-like protein with 3'-5' exonuclease and polymerase domains